MLVSAAKLRKVRHRSLHELCVRGKQETAKWAERLRRAVPGEMSDGAWLGELRVASRSVPGEASASLILQRIRTSPGRTFFSSLAYRSEIVTLMNVHFAS